MQVIRHSSPSGAFRHLLERENGRYRAVGATAGVIRSFEQLTARDTDLARGKGPTLGELVSAGMPLPPAFVLTADAFQQLTSTPVGSDRSTPSIWLRVYGRTTVIQNPIGACAGSGNTESGG
jgi:hypothetical protein